MRGFAIWWHANFMWRNVRTAAIITVCLLGPRLLMDQIEQKPFDFIDLFTAALLGAMYGRPVK